MKKEFLSARAPEGLCQALTTYCEFTGANKSQVIIEAIAAYISFDLEGGAEKPDHIKTLNFLDEAMKEFSLRMGSAQNDIDHLKSGEVIGLGGEARVNTETFTIQGFTADKVLPYKEVPLDEVFANLRAAADGCFDHIDPEEFVAEMRGEDW